MPPKKPTPAGSRASKRSTRATASTSSTKQNAASIYEELIAEVASETDSQRQDEPPLKRRKPTLRTKQASNKDAPQHAPQSAVQSPQPTTAEATPANDTYDASDSDLAFEDVDIGNGSADDLDSDDDLEDINVSLDPPNHKGTPLSTRKKPISRMEKAMRILIHKAHYVALLGHCMIVNSRCNDRRVHAALKPFLTATVRKYLRPNKEHTQFQQDRTFTMGLERVSEAFKDAFQVDAPGLTRPHWRDDQDSLNIEGATVLDRDDFVDAARKMSGSQDTGNQLFCALLRAAGVKARIVCSLQILPLANSSTAPVTPTKSSKPVIFAIAPDTPMDRPSNDSIRDRAIASARSRIGRPAFQTPRVPATPPKTKAYQKLAYPTFWIEVLNAAYQRWMPIDPVVTQTINKASKLEPPLSYPLNQLTYAIAFSRNGVAKDVTRRYAKAYNAKTRRMRLESISEADDLWLRKVMRMFAKPARSDTDAIEETELSQRVAREGLPTNVQDFKNHPVYALERHLKRHEVIHPRREAGKVNAGTAAKPKMEPIFRREDVHVCRSADQWFRHGRIVKACEQSHKLVPARSRPRESGDESDNRELPETALYMLSQTELYIPKPVVRGKVPRNAFGNLDIYVPSMVPRGGSHIRHTLAKAAAAILQIDAVDAVTGFKFSRRKGTTVIEGAVVPEQYADAVQAVIEGLLWQEVDDRSRARSALALRVWKRLLQGLRIAERVASYATEAITVDQETGTLDMTESTAWYADEDTPLHTAGKYSLDELVDMARASKRSTAKRKRSASSDENMMVEPSDSEDEEQLELQAEQQSWQAEDDGWLEGGFLPDDQPATDYGGGFVVDDGGFVVDDGGFVVDGGGFVADDGDLDTAEMDPIGLPQMEDRPAEPSLEATPETRIDQPRPGIAGNLDSYSTSDSDDRLMKPVAATGKPRLASPTLEVPVDEQRIEKLVIDNSDKGSLLSHDPEDDDAEPDWMESD